MTGCGPVPCRNFLLYEAFKLYVLPAPPLQRSRLLCLLLNHVRGSHRTVHKARHVVGLQCEDSRRQARAASKGAEVSRSASRVKPPTHKERAVQAVQQAGPRPAPGQPASQLQPAPHRASQAWQAKLWAGLGAELPRQQAAAGLRPRRARPSAGGAQTTAHAVQEGGPAGMAPAAAAPPLSPAAQETLTQADALLQAARRLNARFSGPADAQHPTPAHPLPLGTPHKHQHQHQQQQQHSSPHAPPYQDQRPPPATPHFQSLSSMSGAHASAPAAPDGGSVAAAGIGAAQRRRIAALVLQALDPVLLRAKALAPILEARTAAAAAAAAEAAASKPLTGAAARPLATPLKASQGLSSPTAVSKEGGPPPSMPATPVYAAGSGHAPRPAGGRGVGDETPRYSPGKAVASGAAAGTCGRVGGRGSSSSSSAGSPDGGRVAWGAGASWRTQVGWSGDAAGEPKGLGGGGLGKGPARRRLDIAGLPYGVQPGNQSHGMACPSADQGSNSSQRQQLPHSAALTEGGQGGSITAASTPTRSLSLQHKLGGPAAPARAAVTEAVSARCRPISAQGRQAASRHFMSPTASATIKHQAAHPAAKQSWEGQQAALTRRALGLQACAPIAVAKPVHYLGQWV